MTMLAEASGIFGETAAGVTLGALRAAVAAGQLGPDDRVVVARHGHGTEDAGRSSRSARRIEIDADVDELLEELGVAA